MTKKNKVIPNKPKSVVNKRKPYTRRKVSEKPAKPTSLLDKIVNGLRSRFSWLADKSNNTVW